MHFNNINNNNGDDDDDNINRIQNSRFLSVSSLRRELSPARTFKRPGRIRVQITCNTSSAYHVQHVVLRATWYEGTAQLLNLTEFEIAYFPENHVLFYRSLTWCTKTFK